MNAATFFRTFLALLLLAGTGACERELPQAHDPESYSANTYAELFDQFWNTMNNRYQFWDQDTTNWDAMYARYQPRFAQLDINNPADQRKSIQYFKQMLNGTQDGHLGLYFAAPAIADSVVDPRFWQNIHHRNPTFYPGEAQRVPAYYSYTYYALDSARYLDPGCLKGTYHNPDLGDAQVLGGTIRGNILYLGYNAQFLTTALQEAGHNPLKDAYLAFRQTYRSNPALKGVIIDMRGSTGGYLEDATTLASYFIGQPLFRGSTRSKSGPGRLDYTPWTASYIQPGTGSKARAVPLVVLTDVLTFSAAEYITTALRSIPGVKTVGTATWGGMTGFGGSGKSLHGKGYIAFNLNKGSFMNLVLSPIGYRFIDGKEYRYGLPPDYEVPFDTVAIKAGRDPQLEKALTLMP